MPSELTFSISAIDMGLSHLSESLLALETAGCSGIYLRASDGVFAPGFGCSPEWAYAVKTSCSMPCEAHLLAMEPDRHIDAFIKAGCDAITLPVEPRVHLHRALARIRDAGASPGISIHPATPLTRLDFLIEAVDRVLLLGVEPVDWQGSMDKHVVERLRILHDFLEGGSRPITLAVYPGTTDAYSLARIAHEGASSLVVGAPFISSAPGGVSPGTLSDGFTVLMRDVQARRAALL